MSWDKIKAFFASLTLERLLPAVIVLVLGILAVRLLLKLLDKLLNRSKLDRSMFTILHAVVAVLLYTVIILIAVDLLGVNVTSLVAIVSVVSLAISLAVQSLLANVVGGLSLLATHPFRVGDWVQIGEEKGVVRDIGIHHTKIMTYYGEMLYIPNSDTVSARICNFSAEGKLRMELKFTASYQDDIDTVREAILEAAVHPGILREPAPEVVVGEYADSAVCYLLHLWVEPEEEKYMEIKYAVTEEVKRRFTEKNVTIPFPQVDVHMDRE